MPAFQGGIIHSPHDELGKGMEIIEDALIFVSSDGNILDVVDLSKIKYDDVLRNRSVENEDVVKLAESEVILPGFIDVHLHAPQ